MKETTVRSETVRVWDPLVRIAHWTLALAFVIAWLTGDENSNLHALAGYVIATIVALRILWGLVGSRHARFTDFVRSPRAAVGYLKGLVSGTAPRYLGHNPAAGMMVIALLLALGATAFSGMMVYAIEDGAGPMAAFVDRGRVATPALPGAARADEEARRGEGSEDEGAEEFWEEIHEASANLTLALVVLHLAGVLASSLSHRENLARAMVTGRKRGSASAQ